MSFDGGPGDDVLRAGSANDTLSGNNGNDVLEGWAGSDTLTGGNGNDLLSGGSGNDILNGGAGEDDLRGGTGDDTYFVDNLGDFIREFAGQGTDTVNAAISWTLGANLERLVADGSGAINLTGNALDNSLIGNGAANRLDGGAGADRLFGYGGGDRYYVDHAGDRVFEEAGGGTDTVYTAVSFGLAEGSADIETIVAVKGGLILGGDILTNRLHDSATGAGTTMKGGDGGDVYYLRNAASTIVEATGEGIDVVYAFVDATLSANVENLRAGTAAHLALTGNDGANAITGGAGDNRIEGGAGADKLSALAGDDRLIGGGGADSLYGGEGADSFVFASVADSIAGGRDTINDFSSAAGDVIDLSALRDGDGGFLHFEAGAIRFGGEAGEVIALQRGDVALLQADLDGDRKADFMINVINGGVALTVDDIQFFPVT